MTLSYAWVVWVVLLVLKVPVDAVHLAHQADSLGVPRWVAWGIAWQESGDGSAGNAYVGPGAFEVTWSADSTGAYTVVHTRYICQEIGRYQINPCTWDSKHPRCTLERITESYEDNVYCGLSNVARLHRHHRDWEKAIERQNGAGWMARAYRRAVLSHARAWTE